jgi:hypothetical protein
MDGQFLYPSEKSPRRIDPERPKPIQKEENSQIA